MFGAIYKTYWAKKNNIDPKDIFFVSVIPCTAKKFEVGRENQSASGYPDVDVAITTRELASMITKTGIDFVNLEDEEFDSPFATATGAGEIFGATGGVMEAALRTAAELILGGKFEKTEFEEVRGTRHQARGIQGRRSRRKSRRLLGNRKRQSCFQRQSKRAKTIPSLSRSWPARRLRKRRRSAISARGRTQQRQSRGGRAQGALQRRLGQRAAQVHEPSAQTHLR